MGADETGGEEPEGAATGGDDTGGLLDGELLGGGLLDVGLAGAALAGEAAGGAAVAIVGGGAEDGEALVTSTFEPPEQPAMRDAATTITEVTGQISRFMRKTSN